MNSVETRVTLPDGNDLRTLEEVAEQLRMPEATLRFHRHRGTGPKSFKLGRRVMYRQADVDAWVAAQYANAVGDELEAAGQ